MKRKQMINRSEEKYKKYLESLSGFHDPALDMEWNCKQNCKSLFTWNLVFLRLIFFENCLFEWKYLGFVYCFSKLFPATWSVYTCEAEGDLCFLGGMWSVEEIIGWRLGLGNWARAVFFYMKGTPYFHIF